MGVRTRPPSPMVHPAPLLPSLLVSTTFTTVGTICVNGTRTAARESCAGHV